jgi:hypothetical protein
MNKGNPKICSKEKVKNMYSDGYTVSEISDLTSIPRSTVWDWVNDRRRNNQYPISYKNDNLTEKREKLDKKNFDISSFLENLAPINLPKPVFNKSRTSYSDFSVILNDLHFPLQCNKSLDIVYSVIDELKPKSIIINGDSLDMLAISRYSKDIRKNFSLLDERIEYHKFLNTLLSVSDGAEIIEINGNHSGDSTFGRWWRYLSERIGELASLPEIQKTLSYENVFLGDYQKNVKMADYIELAQDLVVLHGEVVRKFGGYSARGSIEKYYQSIIMGHTHRVGSTAQRIPSLGRREDKQIYAWEMGCLCDLNPLYGSAPNWQNAFGIVSLGEEETYSVETVLIQNGKANVSTLGKSIFS